MSDKPAFKDIKHPAQGERLVFKGGNPVTPDHPIIPVIEGDGTGRDIWKASRRVFDAAIDKAYKGKRKIEWLEVFAGEKAFKTFNNWLPDDTVDAIRYYGAGLKGPLTTPVGGGIRSINVALRQTLDLYACVRPVKFYPNAPSPVKEPWKTDFCIYRENTEDVYAGIEWKSGTPEADKLIRFINEEMCAKDPSMKNKRIREGSGIGIKPSSKHCAQRLMRRAIQYAIDNNKPSVTIVHKGNIMKFTEGAFREWCYETALTEFRDRVVTEEELTKQEDEHAKKGGVKVTISQEKGKIIIRDRIADAMLQQILLRPDSYSVIVTMNLNGDYISDAAAAQVGGLGIAPGGNVGDIGAVFEATHGTAPKYADQDVINPTAVILSGVMMFEWLGWKEAGKIIEASIVKTLEQKRCTFDFSRQLKGATELKTSEYASALIENM